MIFSFNHLTDKVIRRLKLPICHSDSCVTFYSQQIPAHQQSTDISCQFDSRQKLISPYYIHDFFLSQKFCLEFGTKLSQMYITVGWNHTLTTLAAKPPQRSYWRVGSGRLRWPKASGSISAGNGHHRSAQAGQSVSHQIEVFPASCGAKTTLR
jgi:hypothetical protein